MENTKDILTKLTLNNDLIVDNEKVPAISKDEIATSTKEAEKEKGFKEGLSNNSDTETNNTAI